MFSNVFELTPCKIIKMKIYITTQIKGHHVSLCSDLLCNKSLDFTIVFIYSSSYGSKITDFYFSALSRLSVMLISPVSINVHKS